MASTNQSASVRACFMKLKPRDLRPNSHLLFRSQIVSFHMSQPITWTWKQYVHVNQAGNTWHSIEREGAGSMIIGAIRPNCRYQVAYQTGPFDSGSQSHDYLTNQTHPQVSCGCTGPVSTTCGTMTQSSRWKEYPYPIWFPKGICPLANKNRNKS